MNQLTAVDPAAHDEIRSLKNLVAMLAHEVKRLDVTLALDEEAIDRIIDNLPSLTPNATSSEAGAEG